MVDLSSFAHNNFIDWEKIGTKRAPIVHTYIAKNETNHKEFGKFHHFARSNVNAFTTNTAMRSELVRNKEFYEALENEKIRTIVPLMF